MKIVGSGEEVAAAQKMLAAGGLTDTKSLWRYLSNKYSGRRDVWWCMQYEYPEGEPSEENLTIQLTVEVG